MLSLRWLVPAHTYYILYLTKFHAGLYRVRMLHRALGPGEAPMEQRIPGVHSFRKAI